MFDLPKAIAILMAFISGVVTVSAQGLKYPVLAVRSERENDEHFPRIAEVFDPHFHPPSDLVIIHPDGTEEVLVSGNGVDAILDPKTLDGENVYFVRIHDTTDRHGQRGNYPIGGADIYSINVETREETRWTDQTDAPLPGFADWESTEFGYGVLNMGPQPLPDGRLVYTSSRRRLEPTKFYSGPCLQLHVCHPDGRIECVGPMSQGSALHPELLRDGRLAFSSYESMGLRDERRWSLWQIHPDGTNWGPLATSYGVTAFHFHTQRSCGKIACIEYYNKNNNGFGTLLEFDEHPTYAPYDEPASIRWGYHYNGKERNSNMVLAPSGVRSLTPWTHGGDRAANGKSSVKRLDLSFQSVFGDYLGKVTHPSAAPDNAVLLSFSGGPVCRQKRPTRYPAPHCEVRILRKDVADAGPDDLEIVHRKDGFNYTQPRALVSFKEVYGRDPVALPNKVDHSRSYGVFGSSDGFFGQWKFGLDSGGEPPATSLVFLGAEPNVAKIYGRDARGRAFSSGKTGWQNGITERLRILGEYEFDEPDRPEDDHSFRVKLPADVPFTVAIRGVDGRFLTCGQSWKQVRPGYQEINCMGCHNHAGEPVRNEGKFAWRDEYVLADYTGEWRTPEFHRDVKPILQARCMECHDGSSDAVELSAKKIGKVTQPLQAGNSKLSQRIRGEHGLDRMPLDRDPLTDEQIRIIDEWIDCGCLVDQGQGAAFDVFDQVPNPDPTPEPLPVPNESQPAVPYNDRQASPTAVPAAKRKILN